MISLFDLQLNYVKFEPPMKLVWWCQKTPYTNPIENFLEGPFFESIGAVNLWISSAIDDYILLLSIADNNNAVISYWVMSVISLVVMEFRKMRFAPMFGTVVSEDMLQFGSIDY